MEAAKNLVTETTPAVKVDKEVSKSGDVVNFPTAKEGTKPSSKKGTIKKVEVKKPEAKKTVAPKKAKVIIKSGSYPLTAKISMKTKENPHRTGTILHKQFAKYKNGMTVQQALDAGVVWANLRYLSALEHIKIG